MYFISHRSSISAHFFLPSSAAPFTFPSAKPFPSFLSFRAMAPPEFEWPGGQSWWGGIFQTGGGLDNMPPPPSPSEL